MRLPLKLFLFLFLGLILGATSCATYRIDVTGYLDPARPPSLVPGKTIFVVQSPEADNPLLEREVASKIAKLLKEKGYPLSPAEDADFHLVFRYGIGRGPLHTGFIPRPQDIRAYDPYSKTWYYETVYRYEPYSIQYLTRSLSIRVIDAHKLRESGQTEVVWAGDTVSEGESRDLRSVIDYLLVTTFDYFGKDTGRTVQTTLAPTDLRVIRLRENR